MFLSVQLRDMLILLHWFYLFRILKYAHAVSRVSLYSYLPVYNVTGSHSTQSTVRYITCDHVNNILYLIDFNLLHVIYLDLHFLRH